MEPMAHLLGVYKSFSTQVSVSMLEVKWTYRPILNCSTAQEHSGCLAATVAFPSSQAAPGGSAGQGRRVDDRSTDSCAAGPYSDIDNQQQASLLILPMLHPSHCLPPQKASTLVSSDLTTCQQPVLPPGCGAAMTPPQHQR